MTTYLQQGALFAGRYRVVRCVAVGGMGAVYEVVHLETDRTRALKVMLPHMFQSEELRERFKREAKVAAHINSEFIVEVFDAGVDDATGMPFLVMELLKGEELGHRIDRQGRLSTKDALTYLRQTALALDKTHQAFIVHRDLKPENLFLTEREDGPPRVKVLDFGVAKVIAQTAMMRATQAVGTPMYMAPEQYDPSTKLTGAADIYALGMVAYTLLVGEAYWSVEAEAGNVFAMAAAAMKGPSEPPTVRAERRGVTLPPAFDAWFSRIADVIPEHRFPSATEAVRALAEVFALEAARTVSLSPPSHGQPVSAREPSLPTVPVRVPPRVMHVTAPGTVTTTTTPRGGRDVMMASAGVGTIALVIAAVVVGMRRGPPIPLVTAAPPPPVTSSSTTAPSNVPVVEPAGPEVAPSASASAWPSASASASPSTSVHRPFGKLPGKKKKYTQD